MINKRSLWFLTLFSLILVLSIYYITMPSEMFMNVDKKDKTETVSTSDEESAELVALRVEAEEQMLDELTELKTILTNSDSTTEEKNEAFEQMRTLNQTRGKEDEIEKKISEEYKLKSFVKINKNSVEVVVDSTKHNKSLANKIMKTVQNEFDSKVTVSVKFQK